MVPCTLTSADDEADDPEDEQYPGQHPQQMEGESQTGYDEYDQQGHNYEHATAPFGSASWLEASWGVFPSGAEANLPAPRPQSTR